MLTSGTPVVEGSPPGNELLRQAWRKSRPGLGAVVVFSIFINILKLVTPFYVLQVLDRVIASRSLETLYMLTAITLVTILAAITLEVVRRQMFLHWSSWIERTFGPPLFTAGFRGGIRPSPTASRGLRDVRTVSSFVAGSDLTAWLDVIWAPLFIGCVALISPTLALVAFIACVLALVLGTANEVVTRSARDATYEARQEDREIVSSAERNRESLGSLNLVTNVARKWSRNASVRLDESMRNHTANLYFAAAMRAVGRCLRIAIIGVGIWLVIEQDLTLGAVIAAGVLGRTSYTLVRNAMSNWRSMMVARRGYARIKSALQDIQTDQVSVLRTAMPVPLVIDKVSYRYPNQPRSVIRNLSLTLNPGEVLCVIGPSAAGKSTFCRLVSGLLNPRSGKIRLGDVDVLRTQQNGVKQEVGLLPQDFALFAGTVRENIARMSDGDMSEVIRAAKLAGVHDAILQLPAGYDTEISESEPLLSSGQRKSVAAARAFYGSPPLVVLDEPVPHLDRRARSALTKGIRQLQASGTIVVLTTQSKTLLRVADKAISLTKDRHEVMETAAEVEALRNSSSRRRRERSDSSTGTSK